ncbi:MAG: uridine kinase [Terrimicrobiaceae bacterium]
MKPGPFFIGLAGPSGSGKSCLAEALQSALGKEICGVISLDSYYLDLGHLTPEEREKTDFDQPAALDAARLEADLRQLQAGGEIDVPVYDFSTHSRKTESHNFQPLRFVILEGIFVLCLPGLQDLLDLSIYVALDGDECLARRLARDVHDRGRDEAGIRAQFEQWVRPSLSVWVDPQKDRADLVLDGTLALNDLVTQILPELPGPLA